MSKLVSGRGINDAEYAVQKFGEGRRLLWICPFYKTWRDMLKRCYSASYQRMRPSYSGCFVCSDWLTFSVFREWMHGQDWHGKQIDKDLLVAGNKEYRPDRCVFISRQLNTFMTERAAGRGQWPIGVHRDKKSGKFIASLSVAGVHKKIGRYQTPEEANEAWRIAKAGRAATAFPADMEDERVVAAIMERYAPHHPK